MLAGKVLLIAPTARPTPAIDALWATGWTVETLTCDEPVRSTAEKPAIAVILFSDTDKDSQSSQLAMIRENNDILRLAPVLAIGPIQHLHHVDQWISADVTTDEWYAILASWSPADTSILDRLCATFGRSEIDDLAFRFRDLLNEVLVASYPVERLALAHRVAGTAGTLGFAALGAAWSDPDSDAVERHRLTRTTIHALSLRAAR